MQNISTECRTIM